MTGRTSPNTTNSATYLPSHNTNDIIGYMKRDREHVILFTSHQLTWSTSHQISSNHHSEILVLPKIQGQTEIGKIPQKTQNNGKYTGIKASFHK